METGEAQTAEGDDIQFEANAVEARQRNKDGAYRSRSVSRTAYRISRTAVPLLRSQWQRTTKNERDQS
jgi:hypothetical protein